MLFLREYVCMLGFVYGFVMWQEKEADKNYYYYYYHPSRNNNNNMQKPIHLFYNNVSLK